MLKASLQSRYAVSIVHKSCYLSGEEMSLPGQDLFLANHSWPPLIISLFPMHKRKLCFTMCFQKFPGIRVGLFSSPRTFPKLVVFHSGDCSTCPCSSLFQVWEGIPCGFLKDSARLPHPLGWFLPGLADWKKPNSLKCCALVSLFFVVAQWPIVHSPC